MRKTAVIMTVLGVIFAGPAHAQTVQGQIEALMAQVALLQAQLAALTGSRGIQSTPVLTSSAPASSSVTPGSSSDGGLCFSGTRTLFRGVSGDDVYSLQEYLASVGDYDGEVTGYFGPLTETAVQRWQSRNGVVNEGTPDTTGFGLVGPRTRAQMLARCGIRSSEIPTTRACFVDGTEISSGQSVTLYKQEVAAVGGSSCAQLAQVRSCNNGSLSGDASYQYRECRNGEPGSCIVANTVIPNGSSMQLYSAESVTEGSTCSSYTQTRTCTNGVLSGGAQYQYASCVAGSSSAQDDIHTLLDALTSGNTQTYDLSSFTTYLNNLTNSTTSTGSSSAYTPYIPTYTEANTRNACTYGSGVYPEGTRTEGRSPTQLCLGATLSLCSVNVQTLPQYTCRAGVWQESGLPTLDTSTTQYNTCSPGSSNDCHFCPLAGYGYWTTAQCAQ